MTVGFTDSAHAVAIIASRVLDRTLCLVSHCMRAFRRSLCMYSEVAGDSMEAHWSDINAAASRPIGANSLDAVDSQ